MTDDMEQYRRDLISFFTGGRNWKAEAFRGQESPM